MKTTDWNFRGWDGSLKRLAWCFLDRQCSRVLSATPNVLLMLAVCPTRIGE